MAQRKASRKDALAAIFMAHRRFGDRKFKVSTKSPNWPAVQQAQKEGWLWLVDPTTACLTADGIKALAPYGVQPP